MAPQKLNGIVTQTAFFTLIFKTETNIHFQNDFFELENSFQRILGSFSRFFWRLRDFQLPPLGSSTGAAMAGTRRVMHC